MKLKLKRIILISTSVFAFMLPSAQAKAARINGDFAQRGVTGAFALNAGDFRRSALLSEWRDHVFWEASLSGEVDRLLLHGTDRLSRGTGVNLGDSARNQVYQTGDSVLQTFSLATADRLTLKLLDGTEEPVSRWSHRAVAAIPEPMPLTFIGIGAIALVGIQALRRRRA